MNTDNHAAHNIFRMAVMERNQMHGKKSESPDWMCHIERLKAYRIALHFLRPDLTEDEIYNEVERAAKLERERAREEGHSMKYTLLAVMYDATHAWTVIVGHYDDKKDAEADAVRFEEKYKSGYARCEWTQIVDRYITREDLDRKEATA